MAVNFHCECTCQLILFRWMGESIALQLFLPFSFLWSIVIITCQLSMVNGHFKGIRVKTRQKTIDVIDVLVCDVLCIDMLDGL